MTKSYSEGNNTTFLGGKKTIQQERSGQKDLQHAHKSYFHYLQNYPASLHLSTVHAMQK